MILEDKYQRKILKKEDNLTLDFDFDLPCITSPRRCDVPEILLVVGVDFLSYETCIYIPWEDSLTKL